MERIKNTLKNQAKKNNRIHSSFRDPSGHVFRENGVVYRQINLPYKDNYELLMSSGLYEQLTSKGLLIPHHETSKKSGWKVIEPEQIPYISYPYEWAFSMLKDAALTTLEIQKIALKHGMTLKDASAFNIQFLHGKPVLIDTLSFEKYEEGKPWVAYKQFVEHFLCPLTLMAYTDVRLSRLFQLYMEGVPVDLTAKLLPMRAKLNPRLLFHIFAHSATQKKYSDKKLKRNMKTRKVSKNAVMGLIDSLNGSVKKLSWKSPGTQWEDYYEKDKNNYKNISMAHKAELVETFSKKVKPKLVFDMGANTGFFSRIAAKTGAHVISFDIDTGAIERNYQEVRESEEKQILPLFSDLANPTPGLGWETKERLSLFDREKADVVLALAITHHLAIGNNMPFSYIASCFSMLGKYLVVEFIEKKDSQVQILLNNREDIFDEYSKDHFEEAMREYFTIEKAVAIRDSLRTLYLLKNKS